VNGPRHTAPLAAASLAAIAAIAALVALAAIAAMAAIAAPAAFAAPARSTAPAPAAAGAVEHQTYGRFGQVSIYRRAGTPRGVVVLVSGEDGWDAQAEALARGLQSLDALVIGLDLSYYLRKVERLTQDCSYPAGDFEMLSKLVQKKLELPVYTPPVLAGFGTGATLAYGALAQAPSGSFAGAVSLGFCPEIESSHPLCPGRGLTSKPLPGGGTYQLQPVASLDQPWLLSPAMAGGGGGTRCGSPLAGQAAEAFAAKVKGAAVISPPKSSGHRQASPELRAGAGLKQAYLRILNAAELARPPETVVRRSLADLPLLELPEPGATGDTLAVVVSGDGGWAGLDRDVAGQLAERGFPVVGLNTLQYFWTPRTPEGAAADLARILRTYLAAWKRKDALLIGYSLGAEVLPFMVARLPPDLQGKVRLVTLLGPGRTTSFEFRLSEWLGHGGGEDRPVLPEAAKLRGKPLLCVYGSGEKATSLCTTLAPALATSVALSGAHYLGSNPRAVVMAIVRQLAKLSEAQTAGEQAAEPAAKPGPGDKPDEATKKKGHHSAPPPGSSPPPPGANPPPAGTGQPPPGSNPPPTGSGPPSTAAGVPPGTGAAAWGAVAGWATALWAAGIPAIQSAAPIVAIPAAVLIPPTWQAAAGPAALAAALIPAVQASARAPAVQAAAPAPAAAPPPEEIAQYGRFGALHLLRETPHPANVVLFFSDEAGWDAAADQLARTLAAQGLLVVGIDTRHYLQRVAAQHDRCAYTAGSLENLSKVIQKRLGFPSYAHPLVAGLGGGGALAYGALAQAPANTFRGGLGLAPCAGLPGGQQLCPGHGLATRPAANGGFELLPAKNVEQPWTALVGAADRRCPAAAAAALARAVPAGEVVTLAGVDHAFARPALWQPALRQAVGRLLAPPATRPGTPPATAETAGSPALPGLPLIEMPGTGSGGGPLAVILSGDGGWAGVDREVAKVLAGQRGVPVVGLDTLEYFWNGRTPDAAAADLQRVLRHYLAAWKRDRVLLVGYSLGADVLPFLAARLPADLLDRTGVIAMLGPSRTTPFEIRVKENKAAELPVLPEVLKLRGRPLLCVAAAGEADSLCTDLEPGLARKVELKGSHAFAGDYEELADRILARSSHTPPAATPETGLSPALRSVGLPRRTSSTPPSSDLRAPWIQARLRRLATDACENCGLGAVPPRAGARPAAGQEIYAFHALFYAVFVPRWLLRWWHARDRRSVSHAQEQAAGGSQVPLVLHALAMGVLYAGLARAVLAPPAAADPHLLPPQKMAGGALMLAAAALAAWTLAVFRSWRLAARIEHGHELCSAGPFRRVRHPIYLAMDLLALGSWLWAPTAAVGLGAVLVALAGDLRARTEERLLQDTFGSSYDRYRRQAWRFLPGVY
jgi:type IV secretory pathway VirJ component/protein-S-isoprenylcysteine O-methyltransferase Ste14